ncbi:polyketide synthase dehydratase domain-containing protein, partial [Nocardia sp. NPDC088792]|uniref:polyketide synthase dehydratase domain-containing protein n=1 Tax=Nocardia sp. NPDC088792 TaxID=3364332 RepID=UPI00382DC097
MVAIAAPEAEVVPLLVEGVSIAAVNAPGSVVVSGAEAAVEVLRESFAGRGVKTSRLRVSHAFHSALMDPMLEEFGRVLETLEYSEPTIAVVSNVTGGLADIADPAYWVGQVRATVRFAEGVDWLIEQGVSRFVDVGPDGVLAGLVQAVDPDVVPAPMMRRGHDELAVVVSGAARLFVSGVPVRWAAVVPVGDARRVELPTYAFQHERYWPEPVVGAGDVASAGLTAAGHPLLGAVVTLPGSDTTVLTGRVSLRSAPWLADHVVHGVVLFPGTGFVELAIRAADAVGAGSVAELIIHAPLALPEHGQVQVQVVVTGDSVEIYARSDDDQPWTRHAEAVLGVDAMSSTEVRVPESSERVDVTTFYDVTADHGFVYGPAFRGLASVRHHDGDVFAEVRLPEKEGVRAARFGVHPALLDAVLQAA